MASVTRSGFKPIRIHKNLVIQVLREHPEDKENICPGSDKSAAEIIEYIAKHPGEWFVGGNLITDAEAVSLGY